MMTYHKPTLLGVSLLICSTSGLFAQAPAAVPGGPKLEFEVASIKPAAPMTGGMFRIGMRVDAGRMDYENVSMKDCVRTAYRLKDYQISGPDWMATTRFDITAKLPEGGTKEQVPEMLQALLADRFKISVHHELKPHDSYALVVAKNGPKLTPSEEDKPDGSGNSTSFSNGPSASSAASSAKAAAEGAMTKMTMSAGGGGGGGVMAHTMGDGPGGTMKMQSKKQTVTAFADMLARFLGSPVVDLTEIQGKYDFTLEISREDMGRGSGIMIMKGGGHEGAGSGPDAANPAGAPDDSGSTIFKSVQDYGLKLDKRKTPLDFLVIDHIEKLPTEN
jgi:uncharacterized protein (TIGR03435 family)